MQQLKRKMLQVRLTEEELETIDLVAKFSHHNRSTIIRDLFYEHIKKLKKNPQFARELKRIHKKYTEGGSK
jgi:hypothetical protein